MKLQTLIILVLAVGLLFVLCGALVEDFKTYYEKDVLMSDINTTTDETKYNYQPVIDAKFLNISGQLEKIKDSEGWTGTFLSSLTIFASGVLAIIVLIVTSPIYILNIISSLGHDLGAPAVVTDIIIPILYTMLIGAVIIMIAKFLHRSSPGV